MAENARSSSDDRVEVFDWIAARQAGHVDQVHEHLRPLDVAQELMAEAVTFVRALDQAGQSATTKLRSSLSVTTPRFGASVVNGIVGDLRPRRRDARDQRRLAGVREADQADVGEQLELQREELLFAGLTGFGPARGAIGRRDEPRVAAPAAPALGDEHALALFREIRKQAQLVALSGLLEHQRTDGNGDLEIRGRLTRPVGSLAVVAAARLEFGMKAEVDEGVLGGGRDDEDGAAVTAVPAVRARRAE